jgi:probable rRNA maturation factor
MINIKNTQRKYVLNISQIKSDVEHILHELDYSSYDIGIWFTTNNTIREYNNNYRQKDKATDILSFPYHPDLIAGKRIKAQFSEDENLGDLIISPEYVQKHAIEYNTTLEDRLRVILVHGICHLLGYDHITDSDYKKMHKLELLLLKKLQLQEEK